jgi:hypothetical protein
MWNASARHQGVWSGYNSNTADETNQRANYRRRLVRSVRQRMTFTLLNHSRVRNAYLKLDNSAFLTVTRIRVLLCCLKALKCSYQGTLLLVGGGTHQAVCAFERELCLDGCGGVWAQKGVGIASGEGESLWLGWSPSWLREVGRAPS